MRFRTDEEDVVEVQMAPLIDCVFLLLTFFLVATTLKKLEKELPITLPESSVAAMAPGQPAPFVIGLDENARVYLDSQPVTTDLLHLRLRDLARENPGQKIRVDMDRNARGQDLIRVLDLCQFEGLTAISFHIADGGSFRNRP